MGDDVSCQEYMRCNSGSKSKLCIYTGLKHTVKPMWNRYNYQHTREAWNFLTGSTGGASRSAAAPVAGLSNSTSTTAAVSGNKTTSTVWQSGQTDSSPTGSSRGGIAPGIWMIVLRCLYSY